MKITPRNIQKIKHFGKHCMKELGVKGPIKIILSKHQTGQPTAGYYDPYNHIIFVAVHNRAIADIMRTIAHELTHCRQKQDGIDFPHDDEGLQPYEDEANTMSGRLVRFYGRKHRYIYEDLIMEMLKKI